MRHTKSASLISSPRANTDACPVNELRTLQVAAYAATRRPAYATDGTETGIAPSASLRDPADPLESHPIIRMTPATQGLTL